MKEITYEPRFAKWLFTTTGASWIWLVVRVWLGYQWLHAGFLKITGTTAGTWTWRFAFTDDSWLKNGKGLQRFIRYAALPQAAQGPRSALNYGWYASFLRWLGHTGPANFFSPIIALGETFIGLALILGLFTGIAAFLGGMLTVSFGMAGMAGVNPAFFLFEVLLILAWRNAGYYGLDRYVLPALGTPWQKGEMFQPLETPQTHQLA